MQSSWLSAVLAVAATLSFVAPIADKIELRTKSQSSQDLKLSGDLPGLPADSVRFVSFDQLSHLPQVSAKVTDDPNFSGPAEISGVPLDELMSVLGISEKNTIVSAICDDDYEAHYTLEYRQAHHPILVLRINGKPPAQYARTADGGAYGPYLISHRSFTPQYHILAHADEAQIPNGLIELRFLKQDAVLNAIRPPGVFADNSPQMQGYRIAEQNCFRCHNAGSYGGHKSGRSWKSLARIARADPKGFAAYTKDPQSQDDTAMMPANPEYDDATLAAITAYFQSFPPTQVYK
jgi:hypothetical protein